MLPGAAGAPTPFEPGSEIAPPPIQPGAKQSSDWLKGCLVAAGVAAILCIVVLALAGWFFYNKAGPLMAEILDKAKPEYMSMLTPDHTPEQKAELEKTYDQLSREIREKGMINGFMLHEKSLRILQTITADQKIDVEESRLWLEEWKREEQSVQKAD